MDGWFRLVQSVLDMAGKGKNTGSVLKVDSYRYSARQFNGLRWVNDQGMRLAPGNSAGSPLACTTGNEHRQALGKLSSRGWDTLKILGVEAELDSQGREGYFLYILLSAQPVCTGVEG